MTQAEPLPPVCRGYSCLPDVRWALGMFCIPSVDVRRSCGPCVRADQALRPGDVLLVARAANSGQMWSAESGGVEKPGRSGGRLWLPCGGSSSSPASPAPAKYFMFHQLKPALVSLRQELLPEDYSPPRSLCVSSLVLVGVENVRLM